MNIVSNDELLSELRIWKQAGNSLVKLFVIQNSRRGIALFLPRYSDGVLLCIGNNYQSYEQALAAYGQLMDKI